MKPILSIDVSKAKSVATIFLDNNELLRKPFTFNHSKTELDVVINSLNEVELHSLMKPKVVIEATGNYSKPLSKY